MTTAQQISGVRSVESLETAMMDLTKFNRSVAVRQSELSLHAIIVSWQVYYIESELWRHITRKNQKIVRSTHIWGRLNACANSVYQALLRFSRAPVTRLVRSAKDRKCWSSKHLPSCCTVDHCLFDCKGTRPQLNTVFLCSDADFLHVSPLIRSIDCRWP